MGTTSEPVSCELRHLINYRVLLCIQCGYCVLGHALDRHLKCIHHMGWAARKAYVEIASGLRLASWDGIEYPHPECQPVPGLPIHKGYACQAEGCGHLCITAKRMQAHWTSKHRSLRLRPGRSQSRRATLQTFFKGSGLRYFEVSHRMNPSKTSASERNHNLSLTKSPMVDSEKASTTDWLLSKEFQDHCWPTVVPCKSTKQSWCNEMLQIADSTEVLRHAMLSVTASFIAHKYPASRSLYRSKAEKYRRLAIHELSICSGVSKEPGTFFAHFNMQRLMTICYISEMRAMFLENQCERFVADTVLPQWIPVQRKGRAVVWQHRGQGRVIDAIHGSGRVLYDAVYLMPEVTVAVNPYDDRLRTLESSLPQLVNDDATGSCTQALSMLRRVWEIPHKQTITSFRDMALMWTARVPDDFLDSLQRDDPAALIIFAHYCVLWSFAENECWYMKGHAEDMLYRIASHLPWDLQDWISWPVDMLLGR